MNGLGLNGEAFDFERSYVLRGVHMESQQFLVCKNERCSEHIPLLSSRHKRSYEAPAMSVTYPQPNNFVCPYGHVFAYTGQEAFPDLSDSWAQLPDLIYGLIKFRCEAEDCESILFIHKPTLRTEDALAALEVEAKGWKLHCVCENGHVITRLPAAFARSSYESSEWLTRKRQI